MSSRKTQLLFVHNNGPTHIDGRDHEINTKIRQHIMLDIGRERRKQPRNPQLNIVLEFPDNSNAEQAGLIEVNPHDNESADKRHLTSLARPFWDQHPLSVLESLWEMDMFSAYGIMLMLNEGRNLAAADCSVESFWFPFAFQKSLFLRHYAQLFTRPGRLAGVSYEKPARFRVIALRRSLGSIACIESGLANPDFNKASTERVILGIIAVISFNLISFDFGQALVHMGGLESLIAARGEISYLRDNDELRLMLFWVDVMTALLDDRSPRFPLPSDLISIIPLTPFHNTLPLPLCGLMNAKSGKDENISHVLSCMMDLNAIAALIESELAVRGDALWEESMFLGLRVDPVAHRLLYRSTAAGNSSQSNTISEALRLGALLWVVWIKRRYRSYPGSPTTIVQRLLSIQTQPEWTDVSSDSNMSSIQLWLLVLCGINGNGPAGPKSSVRMLALRMRQMGWNDWSEVMTHVCQMPWTHAFDSAVVHLAERVIGIRQQS
ncbi:hypothetical protein F4782DRAFT_491731 [Xylaria castorea]|nr:hypothetical protein F4782DRAFT_491731 [Xylaria castorea]